MSKPDVERLEQHNVLLPRSQRAELDRLYFEHQRAKGRHITYAAFFRNVVLPAGMTELGERYPDEG